MDDSASKAVQESEKTSPNHASLIDGFTRHLRRRNHSSRTIETYIHETRVFLAWLNRSPKLATLADLRAYQEYLAHEHVGRTGKRLAASSQARNLTALRVFYRYLKRQGEILKSPAEKIRLPKSRRHKRRNGLTIGHVRQMLNLPTKDPRAIRDRALVYFLAATGIRATACACLDLTDIDLERREVSVRLSKGNRSYITFFTTGCGVALHEYLQSARPQLAPEGQNSFFVSDTGLRLDRSLVRYIIQRIAARAGITRKIHPHLFRHFLCTTLLERGANMRVVSEVAGHARLSTTTTYTEVTDELLQRIVTASHPRGIP